MDHIKKTIYLIPVSALRVPCVRPYYQHAWCNTRTRTKPYIYKTYISAFYKGYYTRQTAQNATGRSISCSGQWLPPSARRFTVGNTNKWPAHTSALFYIGTSVNNFLAVFMPSDHTPPRGFQDSPGFMVVQQLCPGVPSNSVLDSKYLGFFPSHKITTFLTKCTYITTSPQWQKTSTAAAGHPSTGQ
jgi:hypothetical protein